MNSRTPCRRGWPPVWSRFRSVHAIRRAAVGREDSVTVIGLGTIGLFCAGVLLSQGVGRVQVVGNKPFQKEAVVRMGLPPEAYYESAGAVPETDVVLECVGKPEAVAAALRIAAPEGRVVTVGNPSGDMVLPKADYWRILRNQLTLLGTWNSSFRHEENDDWHSALELQEGHETRFSEIITHCVPLERMEEGLAIMKDRGQPSVKVMVTNTGKDATTI